jgi:hypothetical protein
MRHRAIVSVLVFALCAPVNAAVPLEAPLQGTLRDNAGMPVIDGAFAVTFSLYAGAEDADAVWTESWASATGDCVADPAGCVMVTGGRFHVRLGAHTPLDGGLFAAHGALWLGVSVEGEPELPRRPLGSTPYARHAGAAEALACSGCVDIEHLAPGVVEALASSEITAEDLPGGHDPL